MSRLRAHPTALCLALVVAGVLLGNALAVAGVADVDPLHIRSGLDIAGDPPWLAGFETIDPNDGFTAHALGRQAALQWLAGEVPWWNPYEGFGAPLVGEMQSAAFFPPVLLLRLPGGQLAFHMLLEALAGAGTFLFLRRLAVSRAAATAAGIAFGLSGTFAWLGNAVVNPIAFLPWTMLGVELLFDPEARTRRLGRLVVAGSLALSLYAGFPEMAYINGLLVVAWSVRRLVQHRDQLAARCGDLAVGVGLGLALSAPSVVAFLTYLPDADVGGHVGVFHDLALAPLARATAVTPYLLGPIFGWVNQDATGQWGALWGSVGGYLTMGTALLAGLALTVRRDRVERADRVDRIVLAAVAVLFLARMYGVPVVGRVVAYVPAVSLAAFHRYAGPPVTLALVTLAAMAVDDVAAGRVGRRVVAIAAGVAAAGVALLALPAVEPLRALPDAPGKRWWVAASLALALGVIVVVAAAGWVRRPATRRGLLVGVLAAEAVALFLVPQLSARRNVVVNPAVMRFLQENLGTASFVSFGAVAPNYGSFFGVRQVNVNDLPIPKAYATVVSQRLSPNSNPVVFTGTDVIDPAGPSPLTEFLDRVPAYEEVGVRYAVVRRGDLEGEAAAARGLRSVYADEAFEVFELPRPRPYLEPAAGSGCTVDGATFAGAVVDCPRPTTLVRRELNLPGWTAEVDGAGVEVRPAGDAFQAVDVPAGRHTVTFSYLPPYTAPALVLFAAGVLFAAVEVIRLVRDRRSPGAPVDLDGDPAADLDGDPAGTRA